MRTFLTTFLIFLTFYSFCQEGYNDYSNSQKERIFFDDFSNNSNGWFVGNTDKSLARIEQGAYYYKTKNDKSKTFTKVVDLDEKRDFEIEVRFKLVDGPSNGQGIVWGRNKVSPISHYGFFVSNTKEYGVFRLDGSYEPIIDYIKTDHIYPTTYNIITIRKVGYWNYFFVNGQYVNKAPFEPFFGPKFGFVTSPKSTVMVDYMLVAYLNQVESTTNLPPTIVVTDPVLQRGFRKVQDKIVRVEGYATDADGIFEVTVNGNEARLSQGGNFTIDVPLSVGSNTMRIVATDTKRLSSTKTITIDREGQGITSNSSINQKRMALIIGNAQYDAGGSLKNPVNDARAMETTLRALGFEVIKVENASQASMKRSIDDFGRRLNGYDVGLFFYAGHGVQVKGSNYLIPSDASVSTENDVEYNCVRADRVLAKMEDAGSKTNIVVLDACRNNPFERSWNRSANGNGLAFMNAPSGSLVAYATAPGSVASDGSGANGLYTEALLQHIRTPNLTIEEVFKRVRATVAERSGGGQTPWESTSLTGNFYFK